MAGHVDVFLSAFLSTISFQRNVSVILVYEASADLYSAVRGSKNPGQSFFALTKIAKLR